MVEQWVHAGVLVLMGLGVGLLGHWGRTHALVLVPDHFEVFDRERRIRSLHRGSCACYIAGLVLAGAGVLALV
ncbi:hypothetical protein ASE01_13745 [Nocardioides sp. Root190]|uniref:hypothetical protein n=1 Tax=Nocardioides sp. Root190 TaxID=1736488 RepID=UPI0006F8D4AC|nr:hypothetical protein [Nocardioides sp. Root190]KRB76089.1 hypothetical protein ASE01_13745 [Nocardioides sp. Root190]